MSRAQTTTQQEPDAWPPVPCPSCDDEYLTPLEVLKAVQFLSAGAFACLYKYLAVFYTGVGCSRQMIGTLSFLTMVANFLGQVFWSWVVTRIGAYKQVLVGTQFIGTLFLLCYVFQQVQHSQLLLIAVTLTQNFFSSIGGSIIDSTCMTVLDQYKVAAQSPYRTERIATSAESNYGDLRMYSAVGWGVMSIITGQLVDWFGSCAMFFGFAAIQAVNIVICVLYLPRSQAKGPGEEGANDVLSLRLRSPAVIWFFANLIFYGVSMSLIDHFLFVFLLQDFDNTTNLLLGISTAVMCLFEILVFKSLGPHLQKQPIDSENGFTLVLFGCQMVLALRCWLYLIIPKSMVWSVLLVEPLHGICFAGMWSATMEYAKRLAGGSRSNVARMTALVSGFYYQISLGIGSFLWGSLVMQPPKGLGFHGSFKANIVATIVWSVVWQIGLVVLAQIRNSRHGARSSLAAGLDPLGRVRGVHAPSSVQPTPMLSHAHQCAQPPSVTSSSKPSCVQNSPLLAQSSSG